MKALLIQFGQLGDAVLALPAALALREQVAHAEWTVLAPRGAHAIFEMAGFRDVWIADRVRWKNAPWTAAVQVPALVLRLRRQRFELSVDLHSYKETNLLAWCAGIPRRVAMLRPTRSWPWLITHKPRPDDPDAPILDRYCEVVAALGVAVRQRRPILVPPAAAQERVRAMFAAWAAAAGDTPILGICPGAGHPGRRWPAERFAALAGMAAGHAGRVAVFAGPEEPEALLAPLARLPHVQIWRGLSIPELAAGLAECRVVVANATGPSHIAAAVGTRVLALGEIPAFDPVGRTPGHVVVVRARGKVTNITVVEAAAALDQLWTSASAAS